jgi:hypothetical protein
MKDMIKITNRMKFDYSDLMTPVDLEKEFTLNDLFLAVEHSKIEPVTLAKILQCPYIYDLCAEAKSKRFKSDGQIDHLRLSFVVDKDKYQCKEEITYMWTFDGIGKKQPIPDDLKKHCPKHILDKMKKEGYFPSYGVEFTPVYELKGLPIKVDRTVYYTDWTVDSHTYPEQFSRQFTITPRVTLLKILYHVFYELSFCGSPKQRDEKLADLKGRADEIDKARKEGRMDELFTPWEDVKKRLKKKAKKIKKTNKKRK